MEFLVLFVLSLWLSVLVGMVDVLGVVFSHVLEFVEDLERVFLFFDSGVDAPEHVLGDTVGSHDDPLLSRALEGQLWLVPFDWVLSHPGVLFPLVVLVLEDRQGVWGEVRGGVVVIVQLVFAVRCVQALLLDGTQLRSFPGQPWVVENVGVTVGGTSQDLVGLRVP